MIPQGISSDHNCSNLKKCAYLFFYDYQSGYSKNQLEVFRIAIAGFSLISIFVTLIDYNALLAPGGIVNWEVSNANNYWFEFHLNRISSIFGISPDIISPIGLSIYIISLIFILIGYKVRIASFICLFLYFALVNSMSAFGYGMDIYNNVSLFFLCIFPTGYGLSIEKRPNYTDLENIKAVCIRCLQMYLIITYISAGWEKAILTNWWTGTFLYSVMSDPTLSGLTQLANHLTPFHFKILSWSTIIIESLYFIVMWIPLIRSIWLILVVLLHLYIMFFLSMPMFGLIMILLNIVCWYPAFISDFKKYILRKYER